MSARVPLGFTETIIHFTAPGADGDIVTALAWQGTIDTGDEQGEVAGIYSGLMGNLSVAVTMVAIDFRIGSSSADDPVVRFDVSEPGLAGGNMMPINNAFLVQKRSNLGGRRNRGRMYLPGVPEGSVDDAGHVSTAVQAGLQSNIDDMVSEMNIAGWGGPYILHNSTPFTPTVVSVLNAAGTIATQRTRLAR